MFLHNFIYSLKVNLRDKTQMLWSVCFIIALGTLFYVAFGEIYDKSEILSEIKVAYVIDNPEINENFEKTIKDVSLSQDGKKLLNIVEAKDIEEAKGLLYDKKITGIFYSENDELKLMVYEDGVAESVLASIATKYHQIVTVMTDMSAKHPDQIKNTMANLLLGENNNTEKASTKGNMDVYVQYFYNLIAMACLMAVSAGVNFTVTNQANLSILGARKTASGANSFVSIVSSLMACAIVQIGCAFVGFTYLVLIGVKFGNDIGHILIIIATGCLTGTCLGFFVGNIGYFKLATKQSMGSAAIIFLSFLSGLMVGDMKMIIEDKYPIINRINPAALITDSFYSINVYDTYDRFYTNIVSLLIVSAVFVIAGVLMGRRKSYASI